TELGGIRNAAVAFGRERVAPLEDARAVGCGVARVDVREVGLRETCKQLLAQFTVVGVDVAVDRVRGEGRGLGGMLRVGYGGADEGACGFGALESERVLEFGE